MTRPFRFKHFLINQEKSPMKVGTDSVLLGAWCNGSGATRILDIGTGTGILALMMAQRFEFANITAIEANRDAVSEASNNIHSSTWSDRIVVEHMDLQDFQPSCNFDLIIANPPFFHEDLKSSAEGKSLARHAEQFNLKTFANSVKWLGKEGILAGVYPTQIFERFREEMARKGYNPRRILNIQPTPEKPPHRILFEFFKNQEMPVQVDSLVIESHGRHGYSDAYKALTADFYLNF